LAQGVKFLSDCEFIAIFDADFKPEPDFLLRTAPYLVGNADVGYVQTRWVFTNPEESYLTKVQICFHSHSFNRFQRLLLR
jgi:beta-mannan synthase